MFIILINDLPLHAKTAKLSIYAYDTTQYTAGQSIDEVHETLQKELDTIHMWANNNKMAMNPDKTKSMVVCSKPKQKQLERKEKTIKLVMDEKAVVNVNSAKLLGVYIDNNISWDVHVDHTCKKIRKRLGLLLRSKKFLTPQARLLFNCYSFNH